MTSSSIPSICRHVAQPPSAVVKFFTAWKEKLLKSATLPVGIPLYEAPKECAQSATIGICANAF